MVWSFTISIRNWATLVISNEMAISVLELLKHDRAHALQNPSTFEVLVGCYRTDDSGDGQTITTAELAPLLDERGALGLKKTAQSDR